MGFIGLGRLRVGWRDGESVKVGKSKRVKGKEVWSGFVD